MTIAGRKFEQVFDRDGGVVVRDTDFIDCVFDNCAFSMKPHLLRRSTVSNVTFTNTFARNCSIGPAIIEDVTVDGIETLDILLMWSPFLKHVKVKGKVGAIKINSVPSFKNSGDQTDAAFGVARQEYYAGVDWALDLSEAVFRDFTARGVPASKVRRDPESQVVVTREKAMRLGWRASVSSWNSYWVDIIDIFLARDDGDHLLVVPKAIPKRRYRQLVDGLRELQQIGVAEPD